MTFKTEEERDDAYVNLVNLAGTHVAFDNLEIVAYNALVQPQLKKLKPPLFHISRQLIRCVDLLNQTQVLLQSLLSWLGLQQTL